VEGWATKTKAPDPVSKSELEVEPMKTEIIPPMPTLAPEEVDDLPF